MITESHSTLPSRLSMEREPMKIENVASAKGT